MSKYLSLSSITADNAVGLELQGNRSGSDQTVARLFLLMVLVRPQELL